jgi:hypothetical protein
MRMPGLPDSQQRRGRAVEYALVILTVAVIVALATWFLGQEIATGHELR